MSVPTDPNKEDNTPQIDKRWLSVSILFVGTLLFVIAVFWIGLGSFQHVRAINAAQAAAANAPEGTAQQEKAPQPYPISDFIGKALLVIGGALATHLGAYLGISIQQGILRGRTLGSYLISPEGVSGILAFSYFLTLVASIVFWALTGFSVYAGQPLQDLAYSFLGVFAGAMAALTKG